LVAMVALVTVVARHVTPAFDPRIPVVVFGTRFIKLRARFPAYQIRFSREVPIPFRSKTLAVPCQRDVS